MKAIASARVSKYTSSNSGCGETGPWSCAPSGSVRAGRVRPSTAIARLCLVFRRFVLVSQRHRLDPVGDRSMVTGTLRMPAPASPSMRMLRGSQTSKSHSA